MAASGTAAIALDGVGKVFGKRLIWCLGREKADYVFSSVY